MIDHELKNAQVDAGLEEASGIAQCDDGTGTCRVALSGGKRSGSKMYY